MLLLGVVNLIRNIKLHIQKYFFYDILALIIFIGINILTFNLISDLYENEKFKYDYSLYDETIKQICKAVNIPVIAIGGITHDNVMELAGSGICGIAVVSAIFAAKDITKATRELKELTLKMKDSTCISKDNASSRKGISC